mgnify:CR=1 FL=1
MYICQHPENTRVGANCNSPFHMGEFEMWANFATWMNFAIWDKFAIWMNCNMGELWCGRISIWMNLRCGRICNMGKLRCGRIAIRPYNTRKRPHAPLRQLADFAPTTHANSLIPCP